MAEKHVHTVLIVDDEKTIGNALMQLVKKTGAEPVYSSSTADALEKIKNASQPFSLIISDYMMPGMDGIEFLSMAKTIIPDTIRFLLTGYADIKTATNSVNQGEIHRFISKPWDNHEFLKMVEDGLRKYELIMEDKILFSLAKQQNSNLYALSQKLKKQADQNKKNIIQKEKQIETLKQELEGQGRVDYLSRITSLLKDHQDFGPETIHFYHAAIMAEFFLRFNDLAARNGFYMPESEETEDQPEHL